MKSKVFIWMAAAWLGIAGSVFVRAGDPEVSGFRENVFVSDPAALTEITRMAWAPDGSERLFVTRLRGEVRVIKQGRLLPQPFAKIDPVYVNAECGLLGLCFDPNFAVNRYVYFFLTVAPDEQQIVRFTDRDDTGLEKTVVVRGLPTKGSRHNGGAIAIGPDGKLHWGIGDNGASVGAKANLTSLASKIGRANLDGTPVNDNPFYDGSAGPNNDYIWARGFRNPFAILFQPAAGRLWVNDVGGDYEQIFAVGAGDHAGWDFYEANQPEGYLKPVIKYRTNGTDTRSIPPEGAVRRAELVTITTGTPHGFLRGEKIKLSDVSPPSFNGEVFVASVPSATSFTAAQPGPDETGGGGSAATLKLGGSVTGGVFYDSTAFPREYWGNLFFGDYNSGRLLRAVLDENNGVRSVDTFATAIRQFIDVCVGPDGALYYAGHNSLGTIYRMAHLGSAPKIVVSPASLQMSEGGAGVLSVRLAAAPLSAMIVDLAVATGGDAIQLVGRTNLLFDPSNWQQAQTVRVETTSIPDGQNLRGSLALIAPGLETQRVTISAIDQAKTDLILSSNLATVNEGQSATLAVRLAEAPPSDVTVTIRASTNASDVSVTPELRFSPSNYATHQLIQISASEDANSTNEFASLEITAPNRATRKVLVLVIDNDPLAPAIVSPAPTRAVVGSVFSFQPLAIGNPRPRFSLRQAPPGMNIDPVTGHIWWMPSSAGAFDVTVEADNGQPPPATQSFVLSVAIDQPPQAKMTKPAEGEVVSGANAEWFGDGIDDVATVKAEFYVDGILAYTDFNNSGHFHFGGEHLRWDTTMLAHGPHRLKFVVYDTRGQSGSAEVNVIVANSPINEPPQISVTHPAVNAAFTAPPGILIEVAAADRDGGVRTVEFFVNEQKLGESSQAPFSFLWRNPAPGSHAITARAIDTAGATSSSAPVRVEILEYLGFESDIAPGGVSRGDRMIDQLDWEAMGGFVAGLQTPGDTNEFARIDAAPRSVESALARGDGAITLIDWAQLGRYKAGLDPLTPTGGPVYPDVAQTQAARSPSAQSNTPADTPLVRFGRPVFFVGGSNSVPVYLTAAGGEVGAGFSVLFDPRHLRYSSASLGRHATGASWRVNSHRAHEGRVGIALMQP